MPTLHIARGLPGSGKTTLARKWVAEDPANRARVNRDDLRAMAHGGVFIKGETEKTIIAARNVLIVSLLKRGVSVFNDDTNLRSGTVRDLQKLAGQAGAEFEVIDLTDVSVEACIARDAVRDRPVGEQVIRGMHTKFLRGRKYPLPLPVEPAGPVVRRYVPDPSLRDAVLVDVDGTVALLNGRSPYDETKVHLDLPNWPVIRAVRAMIHYGGHQIVFMSGRSEDCREATEKWISETVLRQVIHPLVLHMRASGDTRKDSIVKAELFDRHVRGQYNVRCVFDDRNQVVETWRSMGLTVFQVADGDF